MEKLKNILYDKSDLLIAFLIVGIAALVIWFGVNSIMKPLSDESAAETKTVQTQKDNDQPGNGSTATDGAVQSDENDTPAAVSTKEVAKIIIQPGESSEEIGQKLISAGVITETQSFFNKLREMGLEAKIQQGTFEIPAGSSLEDVCRIITKTN